MSIKTWKREYYPTSAKSGNKQDALRHSLRKWRGLRPSALKRHRVVIKGKFLMDREGNVFSLDETTCSLCFHYLLIEDDCNSCGFCPLYVSRDNTRCDKKASNEGQSPYTALAYQGDPVPMIKSLEAAVKYVKQQEKERNSKR